MTAALRDSLAIRAELAAAWELPALERSIDMRVSTRMRSALGLFDLRRKQVRLAAFLEAAPDVLHREVVVHELAHAAVLLVHGRGPRPHGAEWRGFMQSAGLVPRVRLPRAEVQALLPPAPRKPRAGWLHSCPVCQAARTTRRPMRHWRCGRCRKAGLEGALRVVRVVAARASAARED